MNQDSEFTFDVPPDKGAMPFADMQLLHESVKGYSRVLTCVHFGRKVVVKALRAQYRASAVHRRMLHKEFSIASGLHHPGIVSVHSMEEVPGLGPAIIMEYVEGMPLDDFIATCGSLTRGHVMELLQRICSALEYLHSRQIVHRDLKPANILVTADGRYIRIIDFGISHSPEYVDFDYPGGTPGYTAPEQLERSGAAAAGFSTDIYSLGCVMADMAPYCAPLRHVASRCKALAPEARPSSVGEVMAMVRRRSRLRRGILASAVALPLLVLTVVWSALHREPAVTVEAPVGSEVSVADADSVAVQVDSAVLDAVVPPPAMPLASTPEPQSGKSSGQATVTAANHPAIQTANQPAGQAANQVATPSGTTGVATPAGASREPTAADVTEVVSYYLEDGRLRTDSLLGDGSIWRTTVTDVEAIRKREAAAAQKWW